MERLGHPTGRASSPPSVPEFSSPVGRASRRAEAVGRLSIRLAIHAPTRRNIHLLAHTLRDHLPQGVHQV